MSNTCLCLPTAQLVLIYRPRSDGRLSSTCSPGRNSNLQPPDYKSITLSHSHALAHINYLVRKRLNKKHGDVVFVSGSWPNGNV